MKSTEAFKQTILAHLKEVGLYDLNFAQRLARPDKNIDDCVTYILNEVQKSGCNGFEDNEIFGMAIHYYDEDKIEIGKPNTNTRVAVNHVVELTEAEKAEAREKAMNELKNEIKTKMKAKPKPTTTPTKKEAEKAKDKTVEKPKLIQPTLF